MEIAGWLSHGKGLIEAVGGIAFLVWLMYPASMTAALALPATYGEAVGWKPSSNPQVTVYHIWYGTTPGNYSANILMGTTTSGTTGLSAGVTGYFVVTDYDAVGAGSS